MAMKYTKRRKPHKKHSRYVKVNRGVPSGMPSTRVANLRYAERGSLTSAGALVGSVYRANSIFDPEFAIGGHQPMGFDTWATLYNHYVVLGSKITVKWVSNSPAATPGTSGIYLTDTSSFPYTSSSAFIEARRGSNKEMPPNCVKQLVGSNKYSAKRFFNIKDVKDNLLRIGAQVTADPSDEAYYMVWFQSHTGTVTWYFTFTIDYIVLFSEPKDLVQS